MRHAYVDHIAAAVAKRQAAWNTFVCHHAGSTSNASDATGECRWSVGLTVMTSSR